MHKFADVLAISCSGLCAVQCVFTPAALILVPVFGAGVMADEAFHRAILWLVLPASVLVLALGCFRHKDRGVALFGLLGLGVIAAAGARSMSACASRAAAPRSARPCQRPPRAGTLW